MAKVDQKLASKENPNGQGELKTRQVKVLIN